jgi:hypothetical protein
MKSDALERATEYTLLGEDLIQGQLNNFAIGVGVGIAVSKGYYGERDFVFRAVKEVQRFIEEDGGDLEATWKRAATFFIALAESLPPQDDAAKPD